MINYKENEKYFKQNAPAGQLYRIVRFVLFVWLGINTFVMLVSPGARFQCFFRAILPLAILIIMYLFKRRHSIFRPDHEMIDAQVQELINGQKQGALRALCLEEEELAATPFLLWGYNFWGSYSQSYGRSNLGDVKGRDGRWRSPEIELDSWIFTEDQIFFHRKTISLVWYGYDRETTNAVFYRDVASVRKEATPYQTKFIVTNYAGEKMVCNCTDAELVDHAVTALQNLVKEKKR